MYILFLLLMSQSAFGMKHLNSGLEKHRGLESQALQLKALEEEHGATQQQLITLRESYEQEIVALQGNYQACSLEDLEKVEKFLAEKEAAFNKGLDALEVTLRDAAEFVTSQKAASHVAQQVPAAAAQPAVRTVEPDYQSGTLIYTDVCKAVRHGHLPSVVLLHRNGKSLEKEDKKGYRLLQLAALTGKLHIVSYLLDNGVNVGEQGTRGKTAVYMSTRYDIPGARETTQLLLDRGADLTEKNKSAVYKKENYSTALARAFAKGLSAQVINIVEQLPEDVVKVEIGKAVNDLSILAEEMKSNNLFRKAKVEAVEALLKKEPQLTHQTTLIEEAVQSNNPAWVSWLLDQGFEVDVPHLFRTMECNHVPMLKAFSKKSSVVEYYNERIPQMIHAGCKGEDPRAVVDWFYGGVPFGSTAEVEAALNKEPKSYYKNSCIVLLRILGVGRNKRWLKDEEDGYSSVKSYVAQHLDEWLENARCGRGRHNEVASEGLGKALWRYGLVDKVQPLYARYRKERDEERAAYSIQFYKQHKPIVEVFLRGAIKDRDLKDVAEFAKEYPCQEAFIDQVLGEMNLPADEQQAYKKSVMAAMDLHKQYRDQHEQKLAEYVPMAQAYSRRILHQAIQDRDLTMIQEIGQEFQFEEEQIDKALGQMSLFGAELQTYRESVMSLLGRKSQGAE